MTLSVGFPTAPRILLKSGPSAMPLVISLKTVPQGVLYDWVQGYHDSPSSCACEILAISECVTYIQSKKKIKRVEVIPVEFYESSLDILMMRGNFLVRNTVLAKERAQRSSSVTSNPPAKVVKMCKKKPTGWQR